MLPRAVINVVASRPHVSNATPWGCSRVMIVESSIIEYTGSLMGVTWLKWTYNVTVNVRFKRYLSSLHWFSDDGFKWCTKKMTGEVGPSILERNASQDATTRQRYHQNCCAIIEPFWDAVFFAQNNLEPLSPWGTSPLWPQPSGNTTTYQTHQGLQS